MRVDFFRTSLLRDMLDEILRCFHIHVSQPSRPCWALHPIHLPKPSVTSVMKVCVRLNLRDLNSIGFLPECRWWNNVKQACRSIPIVYRYIYIYIDSLKTNMAPDEEKKMGPWSDRLLPYVTWTLLRCLSVWGHGVEMGFCSWFSLVGLWSILSQPCHWVPIMTSPAMKHQGVPKEIILKL